MNLENVQLPVGSESADPTALMLGIGIAVAVVLVALSAPRLFAFFTVAGVVAGALLVS